ncbi:VQ motif containing protein [Quillaja saponaria]|uniref:VQ motif containing protein n=1 Tax=Quillaja saponaria TaxID=32244 RepID=A0AAD7PB10_QUISA|nr:VQ motif containing protein [Quillaja saponaria]
MSSGYKQPVKVVIINTHYVETDAVSFKAVVQKLTGKDSDIDYELFEAAAAGGGELAKNNNMRVKEKKKKKKRDRDEVSCRRSSILMKDMSFQEFDMLLSEMPSIDELWPDFT